MVCFRAKREGSLREGLWLRLSRVEGLGRVALPVFAQV